MEKIISKLVDDFAEGKLSRRQLARSLTIAVAGSVAPVSSAQGKAIKAMYINHISYQVADYKKTRDFYASLLGMEVTEDDGMHCRLKFGDNIIIPRSRSPHPLVDHIAYTVANWDTERTAIEAELHRRGLKVRVEGDKSFHVEDPDGFNVQIGGLEQ